jgi:Rrf2 family protein
LLALADGSRLKAAALAERLDTTAGFLAQAMTPLVNSGWVGSVPGPSGGYELRADLTDVSLRAVIEAVEGPTDTGRCVLENRACGDGGQCALHTSWQRARVHLLADLDATPLSELVGSVR